MGRWSWIIWVGSQSSWSEAVITHILVRGRQSKILYTQQGRLLWKQSREVWRHQPWRWQWLKPQPRNAGSPWKLERSRHGFAGEPVEGAAQPCPRPDLSPGKLWTSGLQNWERGKISTVLSHQVCDDLLQQSQETRSNLLLLSGSGAENGRTVNCHISLRLKQTEKRKSECLIIKCGQRQFSKRNRILSSGSRWIIKCQGWLLHTP